MVSRMKRRFRFKEAESLRIFERGDNMKTYHEITDKIERLMNAMYEDGFEADNGEDIEHSERVKCQIDALLWVIDDTSGAPLIDEQ
jgi:hypothetical protein